MRARASPSRCAATRPTPNSARRLRELEAPLPSRTRSLLAPHLEAAPSLQSPARSPTPLFYRSMLLRPPLRAQAHLRAAVAAISHATVLPGGAHVLAPTRSFTTSRAAGDNMDVKSRSAKDVAKPKIASAHKSTNTAQTPPYPPLGAITFYHRGKPYYEFTNFFEAPFTLDGSQWPTSEHYFQAHKFTDPVLIERIRLSPTPRRAFDDARALEAHKRRDWDQFRHEAMRRALEAKFTQHKRLLSMLLGTGDVLLIEHTKNDNYWGDGGDGTGQNNLGRALMQLRTQLRSVASDGQGVQQT